MSKHQFNRVSRSVLKSFFKNNPIQTGFPTFIESSSNIQDDNLRIDQQNGMVIHAQQENGRLLRFLSPSGKDENNWWVQFIRQEREGLSIANARGTEGLFLLGDGNVGVGVKQTSYRLEVDGLVSADGRIGIYDQGYTPADAEWHKTRVTGLSLGLHVYEVMAHINEEREDRFSLSKGIALFEGHKKKNYMQVRQISAGSAWLWGKRWNRIQFRWKADPESSRENRLYQLEVRTRTHYGLQEDGSPKQLFYRISKLF